MSINTIQGIRQPVAPDATNREATQSGFLAALETARQKLSAPPEYLLPSQTTGAPEQPSGLAAYVKTAAEELSEYLKKTPAQHMRDAILQEMGLSEEALAAMPPEQRALVEDAIAEKMKEKLLAQSGKNHQNLQQYASVRPFFS